MCLARFHQKMQDQLACLRHQNIVTSTYIRTMTTSGHFCQNIVHQLTPADIHTQKTHHFTAKDLCSLLTRFTGPALSRRSWQAQWLLLQYFLVGLHGWVHVFLWTGLGAGIGADAVVCTPLMIDVHVCKAMQKELLSLWDRAYLKQPRLTGGR